MTPLLLALALGACEPSAQAGLEPERTRAACALEARPGLEATVDRGALQAIYARPGFERAREARSDVPSRWLAWLKAKLEAFFESTGAESYSTVTRGLVLVAAALVMVVVLARWLGGRRARPRRDEAATAPTLAPPPEHLATAHRLLAESPRAALREGLLAVLSHLERAHLARPERARTNREVIAELPARGATVELAASVRGLLGWYDEAYYSLRTVSRDEAQGFLARVQAFTHEALR